MKVTDWNLINKTEETIIWENKNNPDIHLVTAFEVLQDVYVTSSCGDVDISQEVFITDAYIQNAHTDKRMLDFPQWTGKKVLPVIK